MVAAAVVAAGVVGAVGSSVAGSEAAGATRNASNAAIAQQQNALSEQAQLSAPYRALGEAAIPQYEALLGITPPQSATGTGQPQTITLPNGQTITVPGSAGGGGAAVAPAAPNIMQALQATPGYQFALDQGERGIVNAASSQGGISGNTLAALNQYNTGLASETYQQNVGDIASAVASGQAAAAGQAQNVGTAASNIGSALINQGNTMAGIDANTVAGITKATSGAIDNYTTMQSLNALNNQAPGGYGAEASPGAGAGTMAAGGGYTYNTPGYP